MAGYDAYGIKYLAAHLAQIQQLDRLAELISEKWLNVKVTSENDTYEGFVRDVMIAWSLTHTTIPSNPWNLVRCIRFALIRTTVNSWCAALSSSEIVSSLEEGVLSPARVRIS